MQDSSATVGIYRPTGIVADGVTDNKDALDAAIAAVPAGQTLRVPPGTYRIATALSIRQKSMVLDLTGVTLIPTAGQSTIIGRGDYGTIYGVTAQNRTTMLAGETTIPVTDITLSSAPAYEKGDVVKIVADDPIPGRRPGDGTSESRIGEFLTVYSVTGSTVRVMGHPRETYTTNVRMARIADHRVHIINGTISYPTVNGSGAAILMMDLPRPQIAGTTIRHSPSAGVNFMGCYGYVADRVTVEHSEDNTGAGNFGYGVMDNGSSYGLVRDLLARNVRHAYTDDTNRIPAASTSLTNYGRTYGTKVVHSFAHGTHMTAWDTHGNSENVTFDNCVATNCARGFSLRGINHQVINGTVDGAPMALSLNDEDYGTWSHGHSIRGLTFRRITGTPIYVDVRRGTHPQAGIRQTEPFYLSGIRGELAPGLVNAGIEVRNATVFLSDVHLTAPDAMLTGSRVILASNAKVIARDVTVDFGNNGGTSTINLVATHNGADFEGRRFRTILTSAQAARVVAVNRISATDKAVLLDLLTDNQLVSATGDLTIEPIVDYQELQGIRRSSNRTGLSNVDHLPALMKRTIQDVAVTFSNTAAQAMPALPNGNRNGQMLTLGNTGTGAITIYSGAGVNTLSAATMVLNQFQSARFMWNGTRWAHIG